MSLVRPGPPPKLHSHPVARRGRPRSRNEIVRGQTLGGLDPTPIAERHGTPFFAYDLDVVARQVLALRNVLPAGFELAYAVKANPSLAILRHLAGLGLGADVASGGELAHALRAGFDADRVVFTGPGKRDEELATAVRAGVRAVTVESPGELARLERLASAAGRRQPVMLRAAVSEAARLERVRLVGDDGAGKFGMDGADLRVSARAAAASRWLEPLGLHAFGASNVLDAGDVADHVEATVETAVEIATAAGIELRLVDAGGGLGIPYETHQDGLDLVGLGVRLRGIDERMRDRPITRRTQVLLEPGRFLVASCGAYVARVVDRKNVGGHHVIVLDGGIHHVLRPVLVGQEHRLRALTGAASAGGASAHRFPVTVAGPLCSGLDVFAQSAVMALPDVGDLLAILDVGAYGATESMPFFLSHPLPAEVAIRGGRSFLARPRIEPEAWLGWHLDEPPEA